MMGAKGIQLRRGDCARLASETLEIVARGSYPARGDGSPIEIADAIANSVDGTRFIPESDWRSIRRRADDAVVAVESGRRPVIEVTGETTLEACRRLTLKAGVTSVAALNFASARNPGGGFLGGSRAQEESLARSSALYATLCTAQAYYDINRHTRDTYYTDCAIYSPAVPVFRDDDGALLDDPYEVAFITCPAVNVSALSKNGGFDEAKVEDVMRRRTQNVLALAAVEGHRVLVLGAWGCGVFGNDPEMIARLFAETLNEPVGRYFDRVVFAVLDTRPGRPLFEAFQDAFADGE